ncbi:MAG: C4-dicarboxylate-specific signal transduction histidine kinase [Zhongshania sp.]|jgi:C4-dicarboxylate-specific signal transduction histidine kinase
MNSGEHDSILSRNEPHSQNVVDTYRATQNILKDISAERSRHEDLIRATLNILEDFNDEKIKLQNMQKGVLNILEDFDQERSNVEITNRALIDEIAVRKKTEDDLRRRTEELKLSHEDVEKYAQRGREISMARDALHKQVNETTKANEVLVTTLAQLKAAQGQLIQSEKLASLGGMVAGVAHEINTPIGIGVTAASTLQNWSNELSEKYERGELGASELRGYISNSKKVSEVIVKNLQRAANLIQSFKKVAVDQSSGERRRFDMNQYVREVLATLHPVIRKTTHKIEVDSPDTLLVDSYPGAIAQIITNFVTNSLHHGFEGHENGVMKISLRKENDQVVLLFSDNGRGILSENLTRIYDPFFTTNRAGGGSGLGLQIVHNLVSRLLGGEIYVTSTLGEGTLFTVSFPAFSGGLI